MEDAGVIEEEQGPIVRLVGPSLRVAARILCGAYFVVSSAVGSGMMLWGCLRLVSPAVGSDWRIELQFFLVVALALAFVGGTLFFASYFFFERLSLHSELRDERSRRRELERRVADLQAGSGGGPEPPRDESNRLGEGPAESR